MKQVIVVNTSIKMSRGKLCAQVAHASIASLIETQKKNKTLIKKWLNGGQKKVVLKAKNENELINLYKKAKEKNLVCEIIRDAGLTEIKPNTITCIGIGPDEEEKINKVTGSLPLLK